MKIVFATLTYSAKDITRGSGTFYHLTQEMERQSHELHYVGPVPLHYPFASRLLRRLHRLANKRFPVTYDPFVGVYTGRSVTRQIAGLDYDVLVTNDLSIAAYVDLSRPVVLYTDAMITTNYSERTIPNSRLNSFSPLSLYLARRLIKKALTHADLCVFPAEWSAEAARVYSRNRANIAIVPFGANVTDPGPAVAESRGAIVAGDMGQIDLLFIGKDWRRKGGPVAIGTLHELGRRDINAKLHIVGPTELSIALPNVTSYGLLNKSIQSQQEQIDQLFRQCQLLLLPTSSEGSVIVPLEAAAYGMPTLAYDAVGVTPSVQDNVSGILLPQGAPASAFADVIVEWLNNPAEYQRLVRGARRHFETSANWKTSVQRLIPEIENHVLVRS